MIETQSTPATELSSALARAVEQAAPSVVRIALPHGHATSGTVWSEEGLILTTHGGTRRAGRDGKLIVVGHDERERSAAIVGRDPGTDLVLLRIDAGELPAIPRVSGDTLPGVGSLALALARPGWRIRASLRMVGLVGPGFRTAAGGRVDAWLESDRALPQGFSGGPLIGADGRMLGLDSRALVPSADLAVPIATLERTVAELLEHGAVRQGWLGISLVPIESGVLVAGLEPEGPGAKAGLLIGDVIVGLDGEPVSGPGALREALRGKAGVAVELGLLRAGQPSAVQLTPADRPN